MEKDQTRSTELIGWKTSAPKRAEHPFLTKAFVAVKEADLSLETEES